MRPSSGERLHVPGWPPNMLAHPALGVFPIYPAAGTILLLLLLLFYSVLGLSCSSRCRLRCLTAYGHPPCLTSPEPQDRTGTGTHPLPQLRVQNCGCCPSHVTKSWEARRAGEVGSAPTREPCTPPSPVLSAHRTATVWKTLSPFWGEEYEVCLQPTFHSVSIYVMDEDALRYGWAGCRAVGARRGDTEVGGFGCLCAQPHCRHWRIHTSHAGLGFGTQMGEVIS